MAKKFMLIPITLLFLSFLTMPSGVTAHIDAKGIIKERMVLMKKIGRAMKQLGAIARGKTAFDKDKISTLATAIARHGPNIPALFPKGSNSDISEASPTIWQNPKGFQMATDVMVEAAYNTASASGSMSGLKTAYRKLGKTCSGCHKQFRIKKKKVRHR